MKNGHIVNTLDLSFWIFKRECYHTKSCVSSNMNISTWKSVNKIIRDFSVDAIILEFNFPGHFSSYSLSEVFFRISSISLLNTIVQQDAVSKLEFLMLDEKPKKSRNPLKSKFQD